MRVSGRALALPARVAARKGAIGPLSVTTSDSSDPCAGATYAKQSKHGAMRIEPRAGAGGAVPTRAIPLTVTVTGAGA